MSKKKTTPMMLRDSQTEGSSTTTRYSPEIALAVLPKEMWQEIFSHLEYSDLMNLKIVSQDFDAIATYVVEIKYEWYDLCRKEVPERHWCKILKNAQHPVNDHIDCRDFHAEKEYAAIWKYLHSTWIEWSRIFDKKPKVQRMDHPDEGHDCCRRMAINGNITAVYICDAVIHFYDILQLDAGSIYTIPCPDDTPTLMLSKKGTDLIATLLFEDLDTRLEYWNVNTHTLIHSEIVERPCPYGRFYECESFGYVCLIQQYKQPEEECVIVEIRRVATRERPRRLQFQIEDGSRIDGVEVFGDTLMLLAQSGHTLKLSKVSIRQNDFEETYEMLRPVGTQHADFDMQTHIKVLQPNVVSFVQPNRIGFSVSGGEWKIYDTKKDLNLEDPLEIYGLVYECGVLALTTETGDIKMIYVDDLDNVNTKLEVMPSKLVASSWSYSRGPFASLLNIGFNECNSKIYLLIAVDGDELMILEF